MDGIPLLKLQLANTVLGADIKIKDIPRQGISHVTADHIRDWKNENLTPRLVVLFILKISKFKRVLN